MLNGKYDLALAMTTYFDDQGRVPGAYRRRLYEDCIASLRKVDWMGLKTLLVLYDDASTNPPVDPKIAGVDTLLHVQSKNLMVPGNVFANVQEAALEAARQAEWVLWLDSDSLVKPDALHWLFQLVHKFPNCPAYGGFNSPYHATLGLHDTYVEKESLTELGTLFRGKDLKSFAGGLWAQLCTHDDIVHLPNVWPCTRPSVVQHTGMIGVNNPDGDDFDSEFYE